MLLDNILYFMCGIHLLYCSLFQPKNVPVCAIFDVIMYVSIVNDLFHITCVIHMLTLFMSRIVINDHTQSSKLKKIMIMGINRFRTRLFD